MAISSAPAPYPAVSLEFHHQRFPPFLLSTSPFSLVGWPVEAITAYVVPGASGRQCGSISADGTEGRVGGVRRKEKALYIRDSTRDFPSPGSPGGLPKSMLGGVAGVNVDSCDYSWGGAAPVD